MDDATPKVEGLGYRPELDGIRALSVAGVLYSHLFDADSWLGTVGVRQFFVLSGFLITTILLRCRSHLVRGETTAFGALKTFYIRRSLRIYPAYYLLLLVGIVTVPGMRHVVLWHALQLSNVLFAVRNAYVPWQTAAFWSLSVEEQFYLIWPLLFVFAPARLLKPITVLAILCSVAYIAAVLALHRHEGMLLSQTPASFDALGAGALVAFARGSGAPPRWLVATAAGVAVLVAPWLLGVAPPALADEPFAGPLVDALLLFPMAAIVWQGSRGFGGVVGRLLRSRHTVAAGRISYGIYLYHLFVFGYVLALAERFGLRPLTERGPLPFVVVGGLTLVVSAVSWRWLERPCNALGRRFPYARARIPTERGQLDAQERVELADPQSRDGAWLR